MSLKVGIQLYSVRDMMSREPLKTISEVSKAGYRYLETANHRAMEDDGAGFGVSPQELSRVLEASGSRVISAHIFPFQEENYKRVIAYNQKIGNHTVVYPMEVYRDYDDAMYKIETYEKMGKMAAEEGMQFLYHNHYQELQEFRGHKVLDLIVEHTDPAHVNLELDTFWVLRGGEDPAAMIRHYGTRVKMLHQKDFAKDTNTPVNLLEMVGKDTYITREVFNQYKCKDDFTEIGYGQMEIQKIIDAALETGSIEYIVLEQDETKLDQLESIRRSMEGFRRFEGIVWE